MLPSSESHINEHLHHFDFRSAELPCSIADGSARGRLRKIGKSYERKREGCRYRALYTIRGRCSRHADRALRAIKPRTGNRPSVASRCFRRFLLLERIVVSQLQIIYRETMMEETKFEMIMYLHIFLFLVNYKNMRKFA